MGTRVRAKVVKNKVAPPFRQVEFDIMFSEGISKSGDLIDLGVELGFVRKAGAMYSYGDTRLGQGRENSKKFLRENSSVMEEIEQKIRSSSAEAAAQAEGVPEPVSASAE